MEAGEHWPLWAVALQDSSLGISIRHSVWLYPFGNVLHVLGVALLVGSILALDFRMLGFAKAHVPVESASRLLTPVAVAGILLLVPGGLILFIADAGPLAGNTLLQWKLALVVIGLANAILFRVWWGGRLKTWDADAPAGARAQIVASVAIWLMVPALGRLIAYF
ncbi:MAG: hypothetical protein IT539_00510 [Bradyrhizobiaceae bacterium]|nr:hypothetical protein [Bradyrhizobiaceae bacterium]